ncbi:MAG: glutaredoxin family protein [Gammaproteobacteria bacterium]|nr:glutaredoxin family protein [Gammaproteobacteria bacterium]
MNARVNPFRYRLAVVILLAACGDTTMAATTVVECFDRDGSVFFGSFCPPGSTKKAERRYKPELGANQNQAKHLPQVTLFSIAECDACDLVRNALDSREVPYNEKNVSDNKENQDELLRVTGGTLSVPTVLVGENSLRGYNRSAIDNALNQAGYPAPATDKPRTP